jgi:ubiquinone/menaquinone biosynthesis C-methylase UbiE
MDMDENNYYAKIKKINIFHYSGEISYYIQAPLREVEKKLLSFISKKSKILDVGCGSGRFSIGVAQLRHIVTGIDITPAAITAASKKTKNLKLRNVNFFVGDMTEMPFRNNEFDYVFCPRFSINAVAIFSKRKKAVDEMIRVVKPGGIGGLDPILSKSLTLTFVLSLLISH